MIDLNGKNLERFCAGDHFFVGCNYWASHAGTAMWRNWDEEIVAADFRTLAEHRIEVLRVFPMWPDFQPIHEISGYAQRGAEVRFAEAPLPDTPAGRAGMSGEMLERFRRLTELADAAGLKLVVGLLTGWMSGRMHVPPALERRNVLTDPFAIRWELRFVDHFVRSFRESPAIVAWDLGNECNCMAELASVDEAWCWSRIISSAIRVVDPGRPVVSGMHSLVVESSNRHYWTISDQAETTDILTTHPYPLFTPRMSMDVVNTMRNAFHATTETRLYGDIGGVPAFVEEAGNLGPGLSSDDRAALYLRNLLWNALAHDCRGVLWWCAHDQSELPQAPYDWNSIERELGLLRPGYHPKPVMKVFSEFSRRLEEFQLHHLPVFRRDAVVLLSHDQDSWTVAHAAWLLAKQAGFDVEFQKADQPLKPASLYLLPSIRGTRVIDRRRYLELLARVRDGATLAVTGDGGILQPFASKFGVEVDYLAAATAPLVVSNRDLYFECPGEFLQKLRNIDAEVLAVDADGDPACTQRACGAGKLIYLNAPLEYSAGRTPRMFMPGAPEFYRVYRMAAAAAGIRRIVTSGNPFVTMTEHREAPDQLRVLAVNNLPETVEIIPEIAAGWQLVSVDGGEVPTGNQLQVRGNDALVLTLRNNSPNLNEPR